MSHEDAFDKWAEDYDESISRDSQTFPFIGYYDVLAKVQSLTEPVMGMTVLDLGIGTGMLSGDLAMRGCDIFGVDFSHEMIQKAKLKIPFGQFEKSDIRRSHLGKFSNSRYDRIISSYFFHHLSYPEQNALISRLIKENLKIGGKIIIGDIGFPSRKALIEARQQNLNLWDDDEYYLCGEETIIQLEAKSIKSEYRQISSCAGVLISQV